MQVRDYEPFVHQTEALFRQRHFSSSFVRKNRFLMLFLQVLISWNCQNLNIFRNMIRHFSNFKNHVFFHYNRLKYWEFFLWGRLSLQISSCDVFSFQNKISSDFSLASESEFLQHLIVSRSDWINSLFLMIFITSANIGSRRWMCRQIFDLSRSDSIPKNWKLT